ncbi:MAG: RNA polymerase sigma factor FliA [Betaproteobacteria bacterium]
MYATAEPTDRIREFAPLVRRLAHHLAARLPASVELDDIIQAGMIGLMDAASRYEEGHGTQFETFASQRIKGAMLDELRQNDWMPRSVRKTLRQIEKAIARLEQRHARAPKEEEIARELGISLADYQSQLGAARGMELVLFDDLGRADDDDYLARHVPDNRENPSARLEDRQFREALMRGIDALPEREKLLLSLYYEQELNFKEIAAVLEVSESRVCQLHGQAVARLRARMKDW